MKILFWLLVFIVFYTYLGYGLLLGLLNVLNRRSQENEERDALIPEFEPFVALIIAAYNEEDFIEDKIANTLELDYPPEKLHVYFVTDGSTDSTPEIVKRYPSFQLLHQPERHGKAAAINRAMRLINEPYAIFCDANTRLNKACIREIVRYYVEEKVGAVAGEKKIERQKNGKAASAGEGLYWKYESFLKVQDAKFHSVVGAAGELFSVRSSLYEPVEEGVLIEDFVLSMRIAQKGYLVKYAPGAYAVETGSASIKDEQKRKIRISAGGFQAMRMLSGLLNIFKYGKLSFQYISHRVLRWSITPLCLFLMLPLNLALVVQRAGFVYDIMLAGQTIFYLAGLAGWFYANRNIRVKAFYIPYYFLFMNLSVCLGFWRFIKGRQSVLWEKAGREKLAR